MIGKALPQHQRIDGLAHCCQHGVSDAALYDNSVAGLSDNTAALHVDLGWLSGDWCSSVNLLE